MNFRLGLPVLLLFHCLLFLSCEKLKNCPKPISENNKKTNTLVLKPAAEGIDAIINSINPTSTNGTATHQIVGPTSNTWNGVPGATRCFLKFDLSSIPSNATIKNATIKLFADTLFLNIGANRGHYRTSSVLNDWYLSKVTSNWSESTVTWSAQPSIDSSSRIYISATTSRTQNFTIDVTNWTQSHIADPSKNFGYQLALKTETPYRCVYVASSDHSNSTLHPEITVVYEY